MRYFRFILLFLVSSSIFAGCSSSAHKKLPLLGRHQYIETEQGTDTIFHTIRPFSFIDQDSNRVTNQTFEGKIYVADFFFTSCPSICPLMKVQLLRVYDTYKKNPKVAILSHSIDPDYDQVPVLKAYAQRLEVDTDKWHFVTGNKDSIYSMAQTAYYIGVRDDGSFEHSGKFILVDSQKHIRGVYDGTDEKAVDKLLADIDILLQENSQ